jgi:hypothetical protein
VEQSLLIDLSGDDLFRKEHFFSEIASWLCLLDTSFDASNDGGPEAEDRTAKKAYHWAGA